MAKKNPADVLRSLIDQQIAIEILMLDFKPEISIDTHSYLRLRKASIQIKEAIKSIEDAYFGETLINDQSSCSLLSSQS